MIPNARMQIARGRSSSRPSSGHHAGPNNGPQGVHTIGLECEPTKPMGLVLHWGVIRPSTGAEWQLLPPELNPPGTTVYKQKALQSPFPAFGALQLVLDPGVVAVEFCLTSSSTGE